MLVAASGKIIVWWKLLIKSCWYDACYNTTWLGSPGVWQRLPVKPVLAQLQASGAVQFPPLRQVGLQTASSINEAARLKKNRADTSNATQRL
jgi:hypothetical protein